MEKGGVIIELDYTALNGAEILFETTKNFLTNLDGIPFDEVTEARYLAGRDYLEGLTALFAAVKTKKTALKASRDLSALIDATITASIGKATGKAFQNFVNALADSGYSVTLVTRAETDAAQVAFAPVLSERVQLYRAAKVAYAASSRDAWCRVCTALGLRRASTVVVTGTGFGVRAALLSGVRSIGVVNPHVEYQDFGGANMMLKELSGKTAKKVLEFLGS